jgi:hypothetical protein
LWRGREREREREIESKGYMYDEMSLVLTRFLAAWGVSNDRRAQAGRSDEAPVRRLSGRAL